MFLRAYLRMYARDVQAIVALSRPQSGLNVTFKKPVSQRARTARFHLEGLECRLGNGL